ncbi:hypothetical protein NT6N_16120 [Oceaniferula spumae]|uniref:Ice-binding protein C-terminal domain-containing protein n=1 Tax=Oceaniferula spumae TaxID=2979115 RepID=A0AAT9FKW5_9BACT
MKKQTFLLAATALTAGQLHAATIISQSFDDDQDFGIGNNFSGNYQDLNNDGVIDADENGVDITQTYGGSGLGFSGFGTESPAGADNGYFGTAGGTLQAIHLTSNSRRVLETGKFGVTFNNQADSAAFVFNSASLTGFVNNSFSMTISQSGTVDGDDDLVVRLYLNGSTTGTDILSTLGQTDGTLANADALNGAAFDGTNLTFNFDPTVTSAQLYIAMTADDSSGGVPEGYIFDNVLFQGTAVPEPSSTALIGLAGLGFILRRRR